VIDTGLQNIVFFSLYSILQKQLCFIINNLPTGMFFPKLFVRRCIHYLVACAVESFLQKVNIAFYLLLVDFGRTLRPFAACSRVFLGS
jgi:hypothetical protein